MDPKEKWTKTEMSWYDSHAYDYFKGHKEALCWQVPEKMIFGDSISQLEPGCNVLELGCGPATSTKTLFEKTIHYVGLDLSIELLRIAKRFLSNQTRLKQNFVLASAETLPFKESAFESVLSLGVLHHLPDYLRALNDALRVLKRGGLLLLREPNSRAGKIEVTPNERGIDEESILSLLQKYGLLQLVRGIHIRFLTTAWYLLRKVLGESKTLYITQTKIELLLDSLGRKLEKKDLMGVDLFLVFVKTVQ